MVLELGRVLRPLSDFEVFETSRHPRIMYDTRKPDEEQDVLAAHTNFVEIVQPVASLLQLGRAGAGGPQLCVDGTGPGRAESGADGASSAGGQQLAALGQPGEHACRHRRPSLLSSRSIVKRGCAKATGGSPVGGTHLRLQAPLMVESGQILSVRSYADHAPHTSVRVVLESCLKWNRSIGA